MAPKQQENTIAWPFLNPAYDSYTNPVAPHDEPYLVSGLNTRTSSRGWMERAPGSASYESTATALATLKRVFVYRRWDGETFVMANAVSSTQSIVYKLRVGTDTAFQSLYTSTGATNTGATSPRASFGKSATVGGGTVNWTTYTNILSSNDARATAVLGGASPTTKDLTATDFGFQIPSNATINGIIVSIEKRDNGGGGPNACVDQNVQLLKSGAAVGNNKADTVTTWPATDTAAVYGSSSDTWGTTWTPADINSSGFGVVLVATRFGGGPNPEVDHISVTIHYTALFPFDFAVSSDVLYYANGLDRRSYDGFVDYAWGLDAPTTAPTTALTGTGITATSGWKYVIAYKNSIRGEISSPSSPSASTGAVTNQTVRVTITGTSTTGVDKVVLYRSTDGGDGIYFKVAEIDNPGATTETYDDATADTSLSTQFSSQAAPANYNDRPPNIRGIKVFANRIWGFDTGTLYYSGWEEINTGSEEACFPSGVTGNSWSAPQEIMALAVIGGEEPKALLVFCRSCTFIVTGDSRDTFSFRTLFSNLGTAVKITGVAEDGDRVFFMGNDNRIYVTDGVRKELVSEAITDDLLNIASTDCAMVVHRFGEVNWLIVADDNGGTTGAAGARWYVLDLTTGKWQAPWAKNATHLHSGETSTGNTVLLYCSRDASSNSIVRKLSILPETAAWTDANGGQGTYTANAVFSLTDLAPSANPKSVFECTGLVYKRDDTSSPTAPTIRGKFDELNAGVTWASQTATTQTDIPLRAQGTQLIEKIAHFNPHIAGRNLLVRYEWPAENLNFKLLGLTLLDKEVGPQS